MIHEHKHRILIVDDEPSIRNTLKASLSAHNYEIAEAASGKNGLEVISSFHPNLIILDLGLPDMPGIQVLKSLRSWTNVPVIILTVKDDEESKVQLLDEGADDYLTKPFGMQELLARVRAGFRKRDLVEATPVFSSGDLFVDLSQHLITVSEKSVKLTTTEYQLLSHLIRSRGQVVSQSELLQEIWGPNSQEQGHYLRIYVGQLRKKIETDPSAPKHILTEPGVGYRIV